MLRNVALKQQAQETAVHSGSERKFQKLYRVIDVVDIQPPIEINMIWLCYIYSLFMLLDHDVSNNLVYLTLAENTAVDFGLTVCSVRGSEALHQ